MKSLDQVSRYIDLCIFTDEDWARMLRFCKDNFRNGRLHKPRRPRVNYTFSEFAEWYVSGFGCGDFACYGRMIGVIGDVTPGKFEFVAYTDYEGKLIEGKMEIAEPHRLKHLDDAQKNEFAKLLYDLNLYYDPKLNLMVSGYTPERLCCVSLPSDIDGVPDIGMYLGSEGYRHHYAAYLHGNELETDCWKDCCCTPFRKISIADAKRFSDAVKDTDLVFNNKLEAYVKKGKRGGNNVYYYLNDKFEIVLDKDNGAGRHSERYNVGNYFVDFSRALLFMDKVKKIAKGEF